MSAIRSIVMRSRIGSVALPDRVSAGNAFSWKVVAPERIGFDPIRTLFPGSMPAS